MWNVHKYRVFFFSCLNDERLPNAPPDALPEVLRTPRGGEVVTVDDEGWTNDRSDDDL